MLREDDCVADAVPSSALDSTRDERVQRLESAHGGGRRGSKIAVDLREQSLAREQRLQQRDLSHDIRCAQDAAP